MERNNLMSNALKDHSIGTKPIKEFNNNNKPKSSGTYEEDYLSGFSWPPRSYTCSFCRREFRSAQALGGHMNVHRRDRARLRQSPPKDSHPCLFLNLNLSPNPNPNFSLISTPISSSLSSPSSASPSDAKKWDGFPSDPSSPQVLSDSTKMKGSKSSFGVKECDDFGQEIEGKLFKKGEVVRLDLEIGLLGDSKEDLDLELRLGYT